MTKYGFPRPKSSDAVVLHCLKGKRALDAADKLSLLNFDNLKIYKGSFADWKNRGGSVETQELEKYYILICLKKKIKQMTEISLVFQNL